MTTTAQPVQTKIWPSDDVVSARYPIFTRANTGEVFVDAATPFTWSLLGRVVYEGGYRDALIQLGAFAAEDFGPEGHGTCECVGSFGGYVYINLSMSRVFGVRAPGMTTDAIDRSFLGEHPDVRPYRPHPDDENDERSAAMGAWMGSILSTPDVSANARHRAEIDQIVAARPDLTRLGDADLLARANTLTERLRPVFATHIVNLYGANVVTGLLAQCCDAVGRGDLAAQIISGFGDVDSAQQSFELWEVSRLVRSSRVLTDAFDAGLPGLVDRLAALDDDAGVAPFRAALADFMTRWGFLGPSVWELRSPTYASNPEIILHMLDGARKVADDGSPTARTCRTTDRREAAIAEVARLLEGSEVHDQFLAAAQNAPVLLPAREGTKVQCTRICDEIRMTMRELGSRLVATGDLAHWSDVLLMMDIEMADFLADPSAWRDVVADRRSRLTELEGKRPPFLVDGTYPSLDDFVSLGADQSEPASAGDVLTGIGVSPGTHRGKVKVLTSLQDDVDIEDGDVLVALTTDSSWGPFFLSAGAVVCETGAAISHAAIVSRELGIPAAVSVPYCTQRLVTGMEVSVDGNSGTVTVHSS
jgi:pyruvate,water dikinase